MFVTIETQKKNQKRMLLLLIALFLFTLWISWGFPPTGDDWNRLVFKNRTFDGFLDLVRSHYETLNGRVLGNLLSYVLIKPEIVRCVAKTVSVLALTLLFARLSQIKKPLAILLGFFFVMTTPRLIFIQVYTWTSGFFNYVPPMTGLLSIFVLILPLFSGKPLKDGWMQIILNFMLGISLCLFVEHVTLFSVLLSLGILIIQFVQKQKPAMSSVALFLGTLYGAIVMFSSPVYQKILVAEDTYRTVPKSGGEFLEILLQNYRAFSRYLLFENPVFFLIVCVVCIFSIRHAKKEGTLLRLIQIWFGILPTLVLLTRTVFSDIFTFNVTNMQTYYFLPLLFDFALHIITFLSLLYVGHSVLSERAIRKQYLFLLTCIPVIVAPLFVVQPVLSRNYYASYLFLALAVMLLIRELLIKNPPIRYSFSKWTILIVSSLCIFYSVIYTLNKTSFEQRIKAIEKGMEQKQDTIIIPDYPVPFFVFGPGDSSLGHMYYYEKANDIEFILESEAEEPSSIPDFHPISE